VVSLSPQKEAPHLNLGNALVRRSLYAEAEREFRQVLAINPLDSRAINGLAAIFYRQERYDEALRLFLLLANEKPENPYYQNNLGAAYLAKGKLAEAEASLQAALRLLSGYAEAYSNLGMVYRRQGRLYEAAEAFSKALDFNPNHANARKNLSELELSGGEAQ
jgi:Flp pilus assembly protein TadD